MLDTIVILRPSACSLCVFIQYALREKLRKTSLYIKKFSLKRVGEWRLWWIIRKMRDKLNNTIALGVFVRHADTPTRWQPSRDVIVLENDVCFIV